MNKETWGGVISNEGWGGDISEGVRIITNAAGDPGTAF